MPIGAGQSGIPDHWMTNYWNCTAIRYKFNKNLVNEHNKLTYMVLQHILAWKYFDKQKYNMHNKINLKK